MTQWQSYFIDALAPLVFRSGKPFGSQMGIGDVSFPLPSSAAGLIRTQYLQNNDAFSSLQGDEHSDRFRLSESEKATLQAIESRGPYLVRYHEMQEGQHQLTLLVPKPADALYLKNKATDQVELIRLNPQALNDDSACGCDLPDGLLPVMMEKTIKGKPQSGPLFWAWPDFLSWQSGEQPSMKTIEENGAKTLPVETRTHVSIDNHSLAAEEGKLFQSVAYDLGHQHKPHHQGWEESRYGFVVQSPNDSILPNNLVRFGGEGRLSQWQAIPTNTLFADNDSWLASVQQTRHLRLTLLSPAIFKSGYLPGWLDADSKEGILPHSNVKVRLKAAAIDRWLPVSGWDLDLYKPKAMRKAVAAGAVYWFEILDGDTNTLKQTHLNSISDHEQDQRDGFGVVSIGAWKQS